MPDEFLLKPYEPNGTPVGLYSDMFSFGVLLSELATSSNPKVCRYRCSMMVVLSRAVEEDVS